MAERTARPRPARSDTSKKRRTYGILGILGFMAIMGPIALLVGLSALRKPPTPPPAPFTYQGSASLVATAWVAAEPSPIPVGKNLDPYLGRRNQDPMPVDHVSWKSARFVTIGQQASEAHRFAATMSNNAVEITVIIGEDSNRNPVVLATPTLLPAKTDPGLSSADLNYKNVGPTATLTPGADRQMRAWAKAYITDDADALYRITGDAEGRSYKGLPGKNTPAEEPAALTVVQVPNGIIANIQLGFRPQGWDPKGPGVIMSMDILFGPFDRDLPYVVAWGATSDGTLLTPYVNGFYPPSQPVTTLTGGTTPGTKPKGTATSSPSTAPIVSIDKTGWVDTNGDNVPDAPPPAPPTTTTTTTVPPTTEPPPTEPPSSDPPASP